MPKETNYQALSEQLQTVLNKLQANDVQVDEAVQLYEQGLKLIVALEGHLTKAQNKVERLKLQSKE